MTIFVIIGLILIWFIYMVHKDKSKSKNKNTQSLADMAVQAIQEMERDDPR